MRVVWGIVVALTASQAVAASECPDLGLSSDYLTLHFCEQLQGIAAQSGQDRSGETPGETPDDHEAAPWRDIDLLDKAYSRDPKRTLSLIERIKAAGGLSEN